MIYVTGLSVAVATWHAAAEVSPIPIPGMSARLLIRLPMPSTEGPPLNQRLAGGPAL